MPDLTDRPPLQCRACSAPMGYPQPPEGAAELPVIRIRCPLCGERQDRVIWLPDAVRQPTEPDRQAGKAHE